MAFEHKENSGSLFRNQRKEREGQPDHTGMANIDGTLYRVAAWINTAKGSGVKYFAMKFTPADEDTTTARPAREEFPNDEIPF